MSELIHQQIEKEIYRYLEPFQSEYKEQHFEFEIINYQSIDDTCFIEVSGYYINNHKPNELLPFLLLKLLIIDDYKQVHICNIFLPGFMRFKGIGKKLIYRIFITSKNNSYDLFLVDMVDSFHKKMIDRSAHVCKDVYDAVQIVDETILF